MSNIEDMRTVCAKILKNLGYSEIEIELFLRDKYDNSTDGLVKLYEKIIEKPEQLKF